MNEEVRKVHDAIVRYGLADPDGPVPEGFPLHVRKNGQYFRKHRKVKYNFGAVSKGWKAALAKYKADWPFLVAGQVPPSREALGTDPRFGRTALTYVANEFLGWKMKQTEPASSQPDQRPVSEFQFVEIRNVIEIAVAFWCASGRVPDMEKLSQEDCEKLRVALGRYWKRNRQTNRWEMVPGDAQVAATTFKKRVRHVRTMLRWAEGRKLAVPENWRDGLKTVRKKAIEFEKAQKERLHGPKRLIPEQIPYVLEECDTLLRATVLLGLLCGFNESDCARLTRDVVRYDEKLIDFFRGKTLEPRKVGLVRVLREALKAYEAVRPEPAEPDRIAYQDHRCPPVYYKDLFFLTERGQPMTDHGVIRDAHGPAQQSHSGRLARRFDCVLRALDQRFPQGVGGWKFKRPRVSFGSLRHMFETLAQRYGDKNLADFMMGHAEGDISRNYDHPIEEDILRVSRYVYRRVFRIKKKVKRRRTGKRSGARSDAER